MQPIAYAVALGRPRAVEALIKAPATEWQK